MVADVKKISKEASIKAAAGQMKESDIGSLIVLDEDENVAGIITKGDIVKKFATTDKSSKDIRVKDVMTPKVITVDPDATLEDAADLMNKHKIKKLPVVVDDKIIGIVTARELLRAERALIERLAFLFPIVGASGVGG